MSMPYMYYDDIQMLDSWCDHRSRARALIVLYLIILRHCRGQGAGNFLEEDEEMVCRGGVLGYLAEAMGWRSGPSGGDRNAEGQFSTNPLQDEFAESLSRWIFGEIHQSLYEPFQGMPIEEMIPVIQLNESDANRAPSSSSSPRSSGGSTPSRLAAAAGDLPTVTMTRKRISFCSTCMICLKDFDVGSEAKQLKCGHCFDGYCIRRWIAEHDTCPREKGEETMGWGGRLLQKVLLKDITNLPQKPWLSHPDVKYKLILSFSTSEQIEQLLKAS
ncbi:hypothetical protein Dimus_002068 [Dionaea muscipula]